MSLAEKIELLGDIATYAKGAKADLLKAATKENHLFQCLIRYQDVVSGDVDILRLIGDKEEEKTKKQTEEKKNEAQK